MQFFFFNDGHFGAYNQIGLLITLLAVRRQNYESAAQRNWAQIIYKAPLAAVFCGPSSWSTAPRLQ